MRQNIIKLEQLVPGKFCKASEKLCLPGPPGPPGLIGFKGTRGRREPQGTKGRRGEQGVIGPPVKAGNQEWLDLLDQNEIKETQGNQDKRVCRDRVVDLGKRYRVLEWLGFRQTGREGGITAFNLILFYLMNNCTVGGSPRPTVEWLSSDRKLVSRAKH